MRKSWVAIYTLTQIPIGRQCRRVFFGQRHTDRHQLHLLCLAQYSTCAAGRQNSHQADAHGRRLGKISKALEVHICSTTRIDAERTDKLLSRLRFKAYGENNAVTLG